VRIAAVIVAALLPAAIPCTPGAAAAQAPDAPAVPARPGLERLARAIQTELRLSDAQAARLRGVSARYAERRQRLFGDERDARRTLRQELRAGDAANAGRVDAALGALIDAQRRRAALLGEEQRELAGFMSPVQRARFLALQERARRAAHRARARRGDPLGAADRPPGPGPFR
jgi:Spy/CpxP family protein refolding chaperone